MPDLSHDDAAMRRLLEQTQRIAVIGHSDNPARTSYQIAQYLRRVGYTVYAVNPTVKQIDGEPSYPSLAELPEPVGMVNVFRRAEFLPEIVEETIAAGIPSIWGQLSVTHPQARRIAEGAGLDWIFDRCIKVEHMRLLR